jgi:hypothetical protein
MQRARACFAAACFALFATLAYLAQRLVDRASGVAYDPLAMVSEPHVAFYWRAATATFWGGLFAIAAWALAGRVSPERAVRIVAILSVPVGVLHVTLSWLFP